MYNTSGGYQQPPISFEWFSIGYKHFREKSGIWILTSLLLGFLWLSFSILIMALTGQLSVIDIIIHNFRNISMIRKSIDSISFGSNMLYSLGISFLTYLVQYLAFNLALRQVRGDDTGLNEIFDLRGAAGSLLGLCAVLTLISTVTDELCCLGFLIMPLFMFAPFFVIDNNENPFAAISSSFSTLRSQYGMALYFYIVSNLLLSFGGLLCCVGLLFTFPIFTLSLAVGYDQFTTTTMYGYGQPQQGAWPPSPG